MSSNFKSMQALQMFYITVDPKKMTFVKSIRALRKSKMLGLTHWIEKRKTSCAIVGNSGILLESQCGAIIDRSDLIVRMNLAPFGHEYSSGVGSKVDFYTFNNEQRREWLGCFHESVIQRSKETTGQRNRTLNCENSLFRLKLLQDNNGTLWFFKSPLTGITRLLTWFRQRYRLNFKFAYSPSYPVNPTFK